MKKVIFNVIGFIILFAVIFACIQPVFIPKGADSISVAQLYNEPPGSLDVFFLGASDMKNSIYPAVVWETAGITSYNLSLGAMNLPTQYYMLKEALRFQTPSVLVISSISLFWDIGFDDDEGALRKAFDMMRWSGVKFEAVTDIVSNSEQQSFLDYLLPFLRYHDRRNITAEDFDLSYRRQRNLRMGPHERDYPIIFEPERPDTLIEDYTIPPIYDEYFLKILDLCSLYDIDVIIVHNPSANLDELTTGQHLAVSEFAQKHNVDFLDLNTPELYSQLGIDTAMDFRDRLHLNILGAAKVSAFLASYISENHNLPDRRESAYDPHWDDVVAHFYHLLSRVNP